MSTNKINTKKQKDFGSNKSNLNKDLEVNGTRNKLDLVEIESKQLKIDLIKHLIFNYIRSGENGEITERGNAENKLEVCTLLYNEICNKFEEYFPKPRLLSKKMFKNGKKTLSRTKRSENNPRSKYKARADVLEKDAEIKPDYSINENKNSRKTF